MACVCLFWKLRRRCVLQQRIIAHKITPIHLKMEESAGILPSNRQRARVLWPAQGGLKLPSLASKTAIWIESHFIKFLSLWQDGVSCQYTEFKSWNSIAGSAFTDKTNFHPCLGFESNRKAWQSEKRRKTLSPMSLSKTDWSCVPWDLVLLKVFVTSLKAIALVNVISCLLPCIPMLRSYCYLILTSSLTFLYLYVPQYSYAILFQWFICNLGYQLNLQCF